MSLINPSKPMKADFPIPTTDLLRDLINQTDDECSSIIRLLDRKCDNQMNKNYISAFLGFSLRSLNNRNRCLARLSEHYLSEILIILRNILEITVDTCWTYSYYLDKNEIGEALAERFFKLSRVKYNELIGGIQNTIKTNIFFADVSEKDKLIDKYFNAKNISNFNYFDINESDEKLLKEQKNDWRALPGVIKKSNKLNFKSRAKIANKILQDKCNNKNPSFELNWDVLNRHTHFWSFSHFKMTNDVIMDRSYRNYLNYALGLTHDILNICYEYLGGKPNVRIIKIRSQFIWT